MIIIAIIVSLVIGVYIGNHFGKEQIIDEMIDSYRTDTEMVKNGYRYKIRIVGRTKQEYI